MLAERVNVIETAGLSKALLGKWVLRDVCFRVAEAECVAITGANGSGKTTLLRCLAGSTRPDGGSIHWYGQPLRANCGIRRLMGFVAHESQVYSHLTVTENLVFAARMNGLPDAAKRAEQLLAETGLIHHERLRPDQISRGQRQRLAIARALIHDPRVLLLDEPFAGLDASGRAWLVQLIEQLRSRGRTVCLTTHDTNIVRQLAPRMVVLRAGELAEGTLELNALGQSAA